MTTLDSVITLATEAVEHGAETAQQVVEATGAIGVAWLIAILPLAGFLILTFFSSRLREPVSGWLATLLSASSFGLSAAVLLQVADQPENARTFVVPLFDWIHAGSLTVDIEILIDPLTTVMLLVVTGVGSLIHLYSIGYMHGDERFTRFFSYLNLFLFSMLVLVLGSSFLTLFVGWELVGLCSYLLIGFWFENYEYAAAAKKAFIVNRVGDVSFMVGMFLIFSTFGSLDFLSVLPMAESLGSTTALAIGLLLLGGAVGKSAQIPLFVWLPDAMAGPTPVSALIHAATMVTAGVYMIARSSAIFVQSATAMDVVAWIGVATALVAALIAIRQDDIKKILAYSTVSQLGYMFVGVGVGAYAEGVFHLVTHAFFKGLLFLAAGSVMHGMANQTDVWKMGGLRKAMPITFATSAIAWLAISGVPPFAGFFSKDQVLTAAYDSGNTAIWAIGVAVAVITAFYMSRWFFLIFLGKQRFDANEVHPHESPAVMTIPLIVLALLSAGGGLLLNRTHHGTFFTWLEPVVAHPAEAATHGSLSEGTLIAISIVAAAVGILAAASIYLRAKREPMRGPVATVLQRKFYVDELYELIFVKAGGAVSDAMAWFDEKVIDGVVNGAGAVTTAGARSVRRAQTGLVRSYVAFIAVGAVGVIAIFLVQR